MNNRSIGANRTLTPPKKISPIRNSWKTSKVGFSLIYYTNLTAMC
jgi:hypothetical protein